MTDAGEATVRVSIPVDSRFIALSRVTAASAAAELDFNMDEIEDLRVAANELVAIVLEWGEDNGSAVVELAYRLDGDALELTATAEGSTGASDDDVDPLTQRILEAVVDEFELGQGSGRILKRRGTR